MFSLGVIDRIDKLLDLALPCGLPHREPADLIYLSVKSSKMTGETTQTVQQHTSMIAAPDEYGSLISCRLILPSGVICGPLSVQTKHRKQQVTCKTGRVRFPQILRGKARAQAGCVAGIGGDYGTQEI
ncbi:MAG: hypothetical protein A2Y76_02420 [Planctomycetes bacterium RBG_13_60_9]|nr:MAG: hypothetical protein A2Y76_02420 [Planctomycetes bacterium RBG_13_60_9]